jgi:hypothetical protein
VSTSWSVTGQCQDDEPLERVAQFAHVARPGAGPQPLERVRLHLVRAATMPARQVDEQVPDQVGEVLQMLAQRG